MPLPANPFLQNVAPVADALGKGLNAFSSPNMLPWLSMAFGPTKEAQFSGLTNSINANANRAAEQQQFDARMQQNQSQFDAGLGLDQARDSREAEKFGMLKEQRDRELAADAEQRQREMGFNTLLSGKLLDGEGKPRYSPEQIQFLRADETGRKLIDSGLSAAGVTEDSLTAELGRLDKLDLSPEEKQGARNKILTGSATGVKGNTTASGAGRSITIGPDGSLTYLSNPAATTDMAKSIEPLVQQLEAIDDIEKQATQTDVLTMVGRGKQMFRTAADRIGVPLDGGAQTALQNAAQLDQSVGMLVDKYRVAVTGAAASEKELALIMQRLPSATTDGPVAFKAKLENLRRFGEKTLATKRRLISEGLQEGTPAYAQRFDEVFVELGSSSTPKDSGGIVNAEDYFK